MRNTNFSSKSVLGKLQGLGGRTYATTLGGVAVCALGLAMWLQPGQGRAVLASAWSAQETASSAPEWGSVSDPVEESVELSPSAQSVANYISRAYNVKLDTAEKLTNYALQIGSGFDIDPMLILAVVATESSFNPAARSSVGAEGLMQVMTDLHSHQFDAFGGPDAALRPYPNMLVGTNILKKLIQRTGSVRAALKWYSGAANHRSDFGYSARVLKERSRLMVAAQGKTDRALHLSRTKRVGPQYTPQVRKLNYSVWANAEKHLNVRLAQANKHTMQPVPSVGQVELAQNTHVGNVYLEQVHVTKPQEATLDKAQAGSAVLTVYNDES